MFFIHFVPQLIGISFCSQPSTLTPSPFTPTTGMSQTILPGLDVGFGGLNCTSCSTFTPYVPANSNKNGNKGIPFAVCRRKNTNGKQCSFFRRLSKSPSISPPLPSEPTFQVVASVTQGTGKCPVAGCGQSRIANDCPRRTCRKHCVEKGGCSSKTHKPEAHTTTPVFSQQAPLVPLPPVAVFPLHPEPSQTSTTPLPTTPPVELAHQLPVLPVTPEIIDARPNPRFASHLHPIFTEALAQQHELREQRRKLDSELQAHAKKTKERVAVYAWTNDDTPAVVHIIQSGFVWPYFSLSSALLSTLGLVEASTHGHLRLYDETDFMDWVAVDVGHMVEVQEGQRIFLKDQSIRKCVGFQKYLDAPSHSSKPHLRFNLPGERAYVREMLKAGSPIPSPQQTPPPLSPPLLPQQTTDFPPMFSHTHSLPMPSLPTPSPLLTTVTDFPPMLFSHTPSLPMPSLPTPSPPLSTQTAGAGSVDNLVAIGDGEERRWPADYHVVDIAGCLRAYSGRTSLKKNRGRTQKAVFEEFFPRARFVPATFTDQKKLWQSASNALRDESIEADHTKQGLWSLFARRVRAERKSALLQEVIDVE